MLVNTTNITSSFWSKGFKQRVEQKYGVIIDISLPENFNDFEQTAEHYFYRISACFDSCANAPKENIVLINTETKLEKKIARMLQISDIKFVSKENLNLGIIF